MRLALSVLFTVATLLSTPLTSNAAATPAPIVRERLPVPAMKLLTPTPTSSNSGCLTISAITILPTKPVPHTTIRLGGVIGKAPRS